MKKLIMVLVLFFMPAIVFAKAPVSAVGRSMELMNEQSLAARVSTRDGKVWIRQIIVDGFLLKEEKKLAPTIKKYRNKRLTPDQVKEILAAVKALYVEAGYEKLIKLNYKIDKKGRLTIQVSLKE